uniref:Putative gsg5 type mucin n=1 Tax=Psorophora albipes TaxID=869069 RepID=T1E2I5_9DIPT
MTRTASMKIAVMLSICAMSWWQPQFEPASAMEIRFPGLGKLSLQFHMEPGTGKVSNSDQASTSEGDQTEDSDPNAETEGSQNQTDSPQPITNEPPKENATEQAVPKEETEKPNQTAATEATTKKDEQATTKAENEAATTKAAKEGKEVTTEKPLDKQKQETTEAAQTEAATEEDSENQTDSPEPEEEKAEAKPPAATDGTTKKAKEKEAATTKAAADKKAPTEKPEVTPKAKEEPATTQAANDKEATTEKPPANQKQQVTEASEGEELTEADENENTTPVKAPKSQPATPKPGKQLKPTEATSKKPQNQDKKQPSTTEASDPYEPSESEEELPKHSDESDSDPEDDFDDSDIWDDTVDPPQEFGQEYDLDPNQLQDHADKSDMDDRFAPKLQLPFDLLRDMFYKPNQSDSSEPMPAPRMDSFFDRLKSLLSPAQLMDRLDRIPGQIQAMVDGLRQKRSDGLKSLREKLDSVTEAVGKKFGDRFGKGAAGDENLQKCVEKIQPAFDRYESVLQKGIEPCVDKTQRSMRKHDSQIQRILAASSEALTDVKECASKMGGSFGEMFRSVISFGSCTTNKFKNKIEHLLGPQLEKLTGVIGKHKEDTEAQINEAIQCVEHRLHVPKLEKLQEKILDKINC